MADGDSLILGQSNQSIHTTNLTKSPGTGSGLVVDNSKSFLSVGPAVVGQAVRGVGVQGNSTQSAGVSGNSPSVGVLGQSDSGVGVQGISASGPAGVYGESDSGQDGVHGVSTTGIGVHGEAKEGAGVGVYGHSATGSGVVAESHSGDALHATSFSGTAIFAAAGPPSFAGYFEGNVVISGSLVGGGAKSAAVRHPDGSHRLLYSMESPECWFEDFGKGKLVRGRARVKLDRDFAAVVRTNNYYVFVTAEGDSKGLYIGSKNQSGFEVREQQNGNSSVRFSYRIVAKRKDIPGPRLPKVKLPKVRGLPKPPRRKITRVRAV